MNDLELADDLQRRMRGNIPAIAVDRRELDQIIAALRRRHEHKRAMIDDVPLCAGHADWWFTSRNHLKGDTSCVVCAFNPERQLSGEMVMVPREPNETMVQAGYRAVGGPRGIYHAMLAVCEEKK